MFISRGRPPRDAPTKLACCVTQLHTHVLLLVFLSVIVHNILPGGDWSEAEPALALPSNLINTRRFAVVSSRVTRLAFLVTRAMPVVFVAPQQNW